MKESQEIERRGRYDGSAEIAELDVDGLDKLSGF